MLSDFSSGTFWQRAKKIIIQNEDRGCLASVLVLFKALFRALNVLLLCKLIAVSGAAKAVFSFKSSSVLPPFVHFCDASTYRISEYNMKYFIVVPKICYCEKYQGIWNYKVVCHLYKYRSTHLSFLHYWQATINTYIWRRYLDVILWR